MPGTTTINEIRIQVDTLKNHSVFMCSLSNISTRHKDRIQSELSKDQKRVSIFEGEILFALQVEPQSPDKDKGVLFSYLAKQKDDFDIRQITLVQLREVPERVIDRLVFAMISYQAEKRGIFTIFGRTLFQPTTELGKLAHKAVEISSAIEDGYIKLYLDPTYIGLTSISESLREEKTDTELVGLCSYRTKAQCPLANPDASCLCLRPGRLGYFVAIVKESELEENQKDHLKKVFQKCPKLTECSDFILIKSSKHGKLFSAFPNYTVLSRFSKFDLSSNPQVRTLYRNATLMLSSKRWKHTNDWLKLLFFVGEQRLQNWGIIKINDIEIPVEIVLSIPHTTGQGSIQGVYKPNYFQDMQIVNDGNSLIPQNYGGAWLFSAKGAFDRRDPNRPFKSISPYLIVPNEELILNPARQLINWFSDGKYQSRTANGDQDFFGINLPVNRGKYNTSFVNVFSEEENIFLVNQSMGEYLSAIEDVKRDWNINSHKDPNKHVIVIIPGDKESDDNPYYYELKKVLVEEGIPSTFITFDTLRKIQDPNVAFGPILQSLWLNIYAKMGGKPWRLANKLGNVHCFIGIGFGINPTASENHIYAGIAHLFDNFGSWVDIASDSANISKNDFDSFEGAEKFTQGSASYKISQGVTQSIVNNALKLYQKKQTRTHENATNIVLHKLGQIYECEVMGFLEGIRQVLGSLGNCNLGLLQIEQDHNIRLYGPSADTSKESYTVYRGTSLQLNRTKLLLATTGRSYRQTSKGLLTGYHGIGTPKSLLLTSIEPSQQVMQKYGVNANQFYDIIELSKHAMALTQLHWGSLKDNVRLPITALYAQKVADLISKTDAHINSGLSYYKPWFL